MPVDGPRGGSTPLGGRRVATNANTTMSQAHNAGGDDAPYRDEKKLRELYQQRELTTREIAERLACDNSTVSRWLNEYEIETRANWRAGMEAAREANREERVAMRTLPAGYEYWASKEGDDRTNRIVYVHRLLAVAEYGFQAVTGNDVHHENKVPWDNRASNIDVMNRPEHVAMHNRGEA